MAGYFDVFISGSPKDNEIFPSGDDKARMYLEKFFNISENECHSYDFYVDAIVNEKFTYYSLLFRRNVVGTRSNGYFALTIRMNGGYHLNIKLMQNVLYHIYERYIEGKIIEEREENKIKSYKYKIESLSNFFTKGNKESIERFLDDSFKNTSVQLVGFDSNKIPFSKTPTKDRNLYVASTNNEILLAELAKTWTLHTYLDYDKNKELENQINALCTKLGEAESAINIRDNKLNEYNSILGSLKNELETTKTDRDSKVAELKSIKEKVKQLENELNNLRNNPKDSFEKYVRETLLEILDSQEKIIKNQNGNNSNKLKEKPSKINSSKKKEEVGGVKRDEEKSDGTKNSPNVRFFPQIKKLLPWVISFVAVVVMLVKGVSSNGSGELEDLKNDLVQKDNIIRDRDNEIKKIKSKNDELKDSLYDYRKKMDEIGGVVKQEKIVKK